MRAGKLAAAVSDEATRDADALVTAARAEPKNAEALAAAARALDSEGRHADAVALLAETLVNITAYEESPLPGLAKRSIDPALGTVLVDGVEYTRLFAIAQGRVLFFWAPAEFRSKHGEMVRDVGDRLGARLAAKTGLAAKG